MDIKQAEALNQEGFAHYTQGNAQKAIECFRKIVESVDPSSDVAIVANFNLACNLYDSGLVDEGRERFEKAAESGHPGANYYLGVILERENNITALRHYVIAANAGHPHAIARLQEFGQ